MFREENVNLKLSWISHITNEEVMDRFGIGTRRELMKVIFTKDNSDFWDTYITRRQGF